MNIIKVCETMTLCYQGDILHVLVSHVADAFGLVELQVLDAEGIEFITLSEEEIEGARIL